MVALLGVVAAAPARADEPSERKPREVIGVEETRGMPPGFHLEQRPRYGLIIGGAATLGVGGLMLYTGLEQRQQAKLRTIETPSAPGSGGEFFMIAGAATMCVGVPLLTYGLLSPRDVYVRDTVASLSLGVAPTPGGAFGRLAFAF